MPLTVLGISHQTAPLEVRERFAFAPAEATRALVSLREEWGIREAVLLSTCNRTELYVHGDDARGVEVGRTLLATKGGIEVREPAPYLYQRRSVHAVRHLFRVSGGLDSMVVGEAEIQGQVREAYELAREAPLDPPMAGAVLHRLFQTALSVGGRIRSETSLGEGSASVASVAVELARKIFGRLRGRRVLILGAGETAELTVEALSRMGVHGVVVANRTFERAEELARRLGGRATRFEGLTSALRDADIVVASTAAPHPVLGRDAIREAFPEGPDGPLLVVDIAVPRDVAPEVGDEPNVFLYNIDDLQNIVDLALERRGDAIPAAETIVREETEAFRRWLASREVAPLIRDFRGRSRALADAELERILEALDHLPEEDRKKVREFSHRLLGKLLHEPTVRLREAAARGDGADLIDAVRFLYDLKGEHDD